MDYPHRIIPITFPQDLKCATLMAHRKKNRDSPPLIIAIKIPQDLKCVTLMADKQQKKKIEIPRLQPYQKHFPRFFLCAINVAHFKSRGNIIDMILGRQSLFLLFFLCAINVAHFISWGIVIAMIIGVGILFLLFFCAPSTWCT